MTQAATRFVRILPAADLRDGDLIPVAIDGRPVVLVRHLGEFFAVQNNCTHHDYPLSEAGFDSRDGVLVCAWHNGCFDVRTGAAVALPGHRAGRDVPDPCRSRRLGRDRPDREPARRGAGIDAIEALPYVNWIFWGALAGGTLLSVGLTEWLGGTTRGYRLFMAVAVLVGALHLDRFGDEPRAGRRDRCHRRAVRRVLVWAFGGLSAAYLVALWAGWPRVGWSWPAAPWA